MVFAGLQSCLTEKSQPGRRKLSLKEPVEKGLRRRGRIKGSRAREEHLQGFVGKEKVSPGVRAAVLFSGFT